MWISAAVKTLARARQASEGLQGELMGDFNRIYRAGHTRETLWIPAKELATPQPPFTG